MQSTISFPIRKKCNFYNRKEDIVKEDFTYATARETQWRYVPVVKKIVTLTSSESESESDIENVTEKRKKIIHEKKTNSISTPKRHGFNESDGKYLYQ
jgi:hypothetical protein